MTAPKLRVARAQTGSRNELQTPHHVDHVPATSLIVAQPCLSQSRPIGYHHRGTVIGARIYNLLYSLVSSTYDEVSPKVEYWIEYALTEQSVNVDDLVEQLSCMAWDSGGSDADIARFLKEFHDAPHRSEQARSSVDKLCEHVLRWFAAASAEVLKSWNSYDNGRVARYGGEGFIRAASFVGYLIEWGLLSHELVRRHLVKPLIAPYYTDLDVTDRYFRAMAIYNLFIAAEKHDTSRTPRTRGCSGLLQGIGHRHLHQSLAS